MNCPRDLYTGLDPYASPFVTSLEGSPPDWRSTGRGASLDREAAASDSLPVCNESYVPPPIDTISLPEIDGDGTDLNASDESCVCEDGYTCVDTGCSYGPGGQYMGNNENISSCELCQYYICLECIGRGRHERHKRYIEPCIMK